MIFYAPNVHVGGGFELLKSLLESIKRNKEIEFILDIRISERVNLSQLSNVHFVKPTIISRLKAELLLKKLCRKHNKIFCFHGLPPILANANNISVFLQNRLYINNFSLAGYGIKTTLRIMCERAVFSFFSGKVTEYIVQSNSMKADLTAWLKGNCNSKVNVFPFLPISECTNSEPERYSDYDFIYVADDSEHKNHLNLLAAWKILAENSHYPSLALTLPDKSKLLTVIEGLNQCGCSIVNLGILPRSGVNHAYKKSRALIYPSLLESFGMPLIEAQQLGLPIIASELDYVRDVINPVETFNPLSSTSIHLSVLRFLKKSPQLVKINKPIEFIEYLM